MNKRMCRETDLVILDMVMPVMSGSRAYHELRAISPDVKVLLSSGYTLDVEARRMMAEGASGFVQKPYGAGRLSRAIGEVFRDRPE